MDRKKIDDICLNLLKIKLYGKVFISDCHFLNEIKLVKDLGAKTIQIIRNDFYPKNLSQLHMSETEHLKWKDCDLIIENNGSLDDLKNKIINILQLF